MKQRKQPVRMCSGCGESKPKRELIRVVKTPDGAILLDKTGRVGGRGAYVCPDVECLKKARRTRRIERSLSSEIPAEVYERLEEEIVSDEQ